ncbi:glycine-tRNA ligase [Acanthamoeba castellanii str. Neff]|uniref:glycine--tRNA ligase n=1 Tax=Acanthamoeba castellanii (strain ATCC 30010 / Neff) TaxID=1257118 RepID=L8GJG9_ACACF|nr:glycine-tRNA ligase [Acanthamoeba castellanii str. Neff]ELR13205.1 glycine-tRNA ligase [Acanthamoeba castellanii str. Neff]
MRRLSPRSSSPLPLMSFLRHTNRRQTGACILHLSTASTPSLQERVVSLCKRRGFVFPNSEIYGGLTGSFDFGPLGAQLKKNIRDLWWRDFVQHRKDCVGIDTPIIINTEGHIENFHDLLVECKVCHQRFRADKLVEEHGVEGAGTLSATQLEHTIKERDLKPSQCTQKAKPCTYTDVRAFNLMFKTSVGATTVGNDVYLRPETAQGIFVNFQQVYNSMRRRLPFGIGQFGKSFRNEVSPGNFLFRQREFEQMELEYFCDPAEADQWFGYWVDYCHAWLLKYGIKPENLHLRQHDPKELAHYAKATTDIEYRFPFGWGEIWGIANRGDFDLQQHMKHSQKDLRHKDIVTGKVTMPYVIEPAVGLDRILLAFLTDAYDEETNVPTAKDKAKPGEAEGDTRVVLRLHEDLAPYKFAVLPLMKKEQLASAAKDVYDALVTKAATDYDDTATIGKRYRRQDEIGTPFCITIDFDTLQDKTVTLRWRDSMKQRRVAIAQLLDRCHDPQWLRQQEQAGEDDETVGAFLR